jgi:hypothetical protein
VHSREESAVEVEAVDLSRQRSHSAEGTGRARRFGSSHQPTALRWRRNVCATCRDVMASARSGGRAYRSQAFAAPGHHLSAGYGGRMTEHTTTRPAVDPTLQAVLEAVPFR